MGQGKIQVSVARVLLNIFDESEKGPFEVPPGLTNKYKKSVPNAPKLYVFQENKSACVFC